MFSTGVGSGNGSHASPCVTSNDELDLAARSTRTQSHATQPMASSFRANHGTPDTIVVANDVVDDAFVAKSPYVQRLADEVFRWAKRWSRRAGGRACGPSAANAIREGRLRLKGQQTAP